MSSDCEAAESSAFSTPSTRPDVKGKATEYISGVSGSRDGCRFLRSKPELIAAVFASTSDPSVAIVKDCYHIVINSSADETSHQVLVSEVKVLPVSSKNLQDPEYSFSDHISTISSNSSRHEKTCKTVFQVSQEEVGSAKSVEIFCNESYNHKAKSHFSGPSSSNSTQLPEARSYIMDHNRCVIQRLSPFTHYEASVVRRGGVIGTSRNCCFEHAHHEWSLSDAVDISPFSSSPSAGPEELSEEENEGSPVDLQYLPEDKKREEDPDIRKMSSETLLSSTATKAGRRTLRQKNVYPVVRELHRWEQDAHVGAACEKSVQVSIGDEPEPGMENSMEVEIPQDVEQKSREADAREREEMEKEERRREEDGEEGKS